MHELNKYLQRDKFVKIFGGREIMHDANTHACQLCLLLYDVLGRQKLKIAQTHESRQTLIFVAAFDLKLRGQNQVDKNEYG